jgi:hypothetical protein
MALTLPTSLGNPTLPQPGIARRVASLDSSGPASALVEGARINGEAWHRTAAGLQDVGKAYDELQLGQDQKEAKDWLNQLIKSKTDLMYGDGTDANPGYMNMKGDAAVNAAKLSSEKLDKLRQDLLGKASNKQVAKMFDGASMELIAPDHEDILKHASQQHQVALDTTDDATVAAASDQMAANPTSDRVVLNSTALIAGSINAKLDRAGITDKTTRDQAILEGVSAAKAKAIQTALVRDPKAGAELYAKWKGQIQGTDQAKLEQSIVQAEDRQMRKQEHSIYMSEAAKRRASDEALTTYAKGIVNHSADPTKYPDVSLETIGADSRLQGPDVITLYNMQKAADKGEALPAVSSKTLASILPNLMAPYTDPKKYTGYKEINELMAAGRLSKADWNFAAGIIDSGKTEDGQKLQPSMSAALSAATRVIGRPDINGIFPDDRHAVMLQQWSQYMMDQVQSYKDQNKNPNDLFNPNKPDYLLSPGVLQQYQIPMDQSIQHQMQQFNNNGEDSQLPTAPSSLEESPVFSNPNDPGYLALPPGAKYKRLQPDGTLKEFTKTGNTVPSPTVSAPTGQ